jgi:lactate dehydrogenase-like 2-hydroxyacid dehydrogenase
MTHNEAVKPEILVLAPLYAPTLGALEKQYTVRKLWVEEDPDAYMKRECGAVRAVVTTGLAGFRRRHIEALPALEIIASFGDLHGTPAPDRAAAAERGVIVTNTPDTIAGTVADIAIGLLISVMRGIAGGDRFVRSGKWPDGPPPPGRDLGGKTCGIIGMGRIGREIARRAEVCGLSVRYHGPRRKADLAYAYDADPASLARQSDCLVVICPHTPETRGMVDARVLDALGPEGFLVNVARGPVVDQTALISALREKRIAGAGLDVYWDEPHVPAELAAMDNVVLTPHLGSHTREIREERGRKVLANLRAHFSGEAVPYAVERRDK